MYARSTTIHAKPSMLDAGIRYVREQVLPAVTALDGCIGMSLLVDRESGRCIATTSWSSEELMRASAEQVRPVRERAAEMLGGDAVVEEWEIAVMHRDHPSHEGACARATWTRVDPAGLDQAVEAFRSMAMPALERLDGFCSASLFVDRASGRAVATATYDSLAALERNRDEAMRIRVATTQSARSEILDVGEFELALAHLRVPETV